MLSHPFFILFFFPHLRVSHWEKQNIFFLRGEVWSQQCQIFKKLIDNLASGDTKINFKGHIRRWHRFLYFYGMLFSLKIFKKRNIPSDLYDLKGALDKYSTYIFISNSIEYFKLNQYRNFRLILPMRFHLMRYFVNSIISRVSHRLLYSVFIEVDFEK